MKQKILIPALLLIMLTIGAGSFLAGYRHPLPPPVIGHAYVRELAILSQAEEIDRLHAIIGSAIDAKSAVISGPALEVEYRDIMVLFAHRDSAHAIALT
jgi:hypothetical protein